MIVECRLDASPIVRWVHQIVTKKTKKSVSFYSLIDIYTFTALFKDVPIQRRSGLRKWCECDILSNYSKNILFKCRFPIRKVAPSQTFGQMIYHQLDNMDSIWTRQLPKLVSVNNNNSCQYFSNNSILNPYHSFIFRLEFGIINYVIIFLCGMILYAVVMETSGVLFMLPVSECDLNLTTNKKGILGGVCRHKLRFLDNMS